MSLYRLIYSSTGVSGLTYQDLLSIMEKSQVNNPKASLTGMLCFGNSKFLQILEGSRLAISQLYHRIANDPRHTDPEIIEMLEIPSRHFGEWSMRVVQLGDFQPGKIKALVMTYSTSSEFDPDQMTPSQCLAFMQELDACYRPVNAESKAVV